jgi:type II secretion system protein N
VNFGKACRIMGAAAAGALLFLFLTLLFVPATTLLGAANRGLAQNGLKLDAASIGKALPLGIKGTGITLSSTAGELLRVRKGRLLLELLPMLSGKVVLAIDAEIGSGTLVSSLSLFRTPATHILIKNVRLEDIPFFKNVADMKTSGILSAKVETSGPLAKAKGSVQLEIQGAELSGIKLGEMPLPDASYRTVQGMIRFNNGQGAIESFTLQGDDLYARLKGGLPLAEQLAATPLDLSLELMPKPALLERQKLVFLLLLKFQDTPGHYQIPVKGTLGKPQVL